MLRFACKLAAGILLATAVATTASSQESPTAPGFREGGEEEQIQRRIEWFVQSRGLDRVSRGDLLRRDAVLQAKSMREATGSQDTLQWQPLGPDSMTMLGWTMGPVAGRVSALAVHPVDENVIYLGAASGGLWKTINGGGSWQSIFDDAGTQTIGALRIDPTNPDTIWVGTGEQGQSCRSYFGMGLFRSTDGGASFEAVNGSGDGILDLSYITAIAIVPDDPPVLLVAGEGWCDDGAWVYGGLYRSTDGGLSFTKLISGAVTDMVQSPDSPQTLVAAVGRWARPENGIYRSTDSGATWERITDGMPFGPPFRRSRLAYAPSDGQILFALVNGLDGVDLFASVDGGSSWTVRNDDACDGQCWYNLCLAVHPTNPNEVLVGAVRFYRSINGGLSQFPMIDGWGGNQKVHQDIHVLRYSASNGDRFWVAGDGGIWRTDDRGLSYSNLNANLNITQFYDIAVHPTDSVTLFGGSQDNSSSASFADPMWDVTLVTGDGFMNVVDPVNPAFVIQTSYPNNGYPSLYLSTSGGQPNTFGYMGVIGFTRYEPWPWVTPLVGINPGPGRATVLFVASNHVYRTTTETPYTWTKISDNLTGTTSAAVSVLSPVVNGDTVTLYAGTGNGKIWRTDDALAASPDWVDVTGAFPGQVVSDIAADPTDPMRVFATRGSFGASRLYRSPTGGGAWWPVGVGIPDAPANSVAVDPIETHRVFVGSDVGVFMSTDGGDNFVAAMDGLPLGVVVTDLEIDDDPWVLTAGTYGRGAWQTQLEQLSLFADGFESGDTSAWSATVE